MNTGEPLKPIDPNDPRVVERKGAKGHKPNCPCKVCERINSAILAGKPTKAQLAEESKARRLARAEARLKTRAEQRKEQEAIKVAAAAATAAIAGTGSEPNPQLVKAITKAVPSLTERKGTEEVTLEHFIQTALKNAGVDLGRLATVSAEGLEATLVKTATHEGDITDERVYADFNARHKYLESMLKVFGFLKSDDTPQMGGLVMLFGEGPKRDGSHPLDCPCADCEGAFRSAMSGAHRDQLQRETNANIIDVPSRLP